MGIERNGGDGGGETMEQITAKCKECLFFKKEVNLCLMKRVKVFPESVCVDFLKDLTLRRGEKNDID